MIFADTFVDKKWAVDTFFWVWPFSLGDEKRLWSEKVGFWTLFFQKWAARKWLC